ncbi:MAG TPA: hypothetical protein VGW58_08190, partial [Pyrinomonadaceae bacterium]|nr:hypothetical protein [Pyrinomonadaceae bacterium]
ADALSQFRQRFSPDVPNRTTDKKPQSLHERTTEAASKNLRGTLVALVASALAANTIAWTSRKVALLALTAN